MRLTFSVPPELPPGGARPAARAGGSRAASEGDRRRSRILRGRAMAHGFALGLLLLPFLLYHGLAARLALPGILDPLYYHHVAESLESGRGLEISYVWNCLERPEELIHPANAYWGPVPSVLMALGHVHPAERPFPPRLLFLFLGLAFLHAAWRARALPAWLIPGAMPRDEPGRDLRLALLALPVTSLLAVAFTCGPGEALHPHLEAMLAAAGLLLYLVFLLGATAFGNASHGFLAAAMLALNFPFTYFSVTTDSPVPFAVLALGALLAAGSAGRRGSRLTAGLAGLLCALAALTRAEGIFLLAVAAATLLWPGGRARPAARESIVRLAALGLGAALVLVPWWARNAAAFGTPFPSSLASAVSLLDYNHLFYWQPPAEAGGRTGLALAGFVLQTKARAVASCFGTLVMGDLSVLALLAMFGLAASWRRPRARPFLTFVAAQFLVLSLAFSYQAMNGTFLHSLLALLPVVFCASAAGLESMRSALAGRRTGPGRMLGRALVPALLVFLAAGWWRATVRDPQVPALFADTARVFRAFEEFTRLRLPPGARLMTNLPFETYQFTRRPCAILPRDPEPRVLAEVAQRYGLEYLAIFDNPKYLLRPVDGETIELGGAGRLVLESRLPCAPGPAGIREVRLYRIELPRS